MQVDNSARLVIISNYFLILCVHSLTITVFYDDLFDEMLAVIVKSEATQDTVRNMQTASLKSLYSTHSHARAHLCRSVLSDV